ncbi:MAG: hypothetical protein ACREIC_29690 [Limisphaerales bacterium]
MTTVAPLQVAQPNYPAVLDVQQVGKWLGLTDREVKALIRAGHLVPLGKRRPRTQKRFAAIHILRLREDLEWLSVSRDIICAHWRKANKMQRADRPASNEPSA